MKKILMVLFFVALGDAVFAGGTIDASMVSDEDIAKIEIIVQELDPEVAIQTALDSFPKSYTPLYDYLNVQKMKINRVFNEYGIEFSPYATFKDLPPRAQVAFTRLKSRYSFIDSMYPKTPDELRPALELLKK